MGAAHDALRLLIRILGAAPGAQSIGVFGALGVGGDIAVAGFLGAPDLRRVHDFCPHLRT